MASDFDFGKGLKELEEITVWFEREQIDLDEGLKKYERGMELAGLLQKHLSETQNRVEKIKVKFRVKPAAEEEPPLGETSDQLF